jgi:hypothetical protein
MTPTDEAVLKQDVLGRVKTPKARREQLLDEFERSGLPGLKFAELAGIKYPTFATWAQKRRCQRGDSKTLRVHGGGGFRASDLECKPVWRHAGPPPLPPSPSCRSLLFSGIFAQ